MRLVIDATSKYFRDARRASKKRPDRGFGCTVQHMYFGFSFVTCSLRLQLWISLQTKTVE